MVPASLQNRRGQVLISAVAIVVLMLLGQLSAPSAQAPRTSNGIVAGQITDVPSKRPVGGAVVTLAAVGSAPTAGSAGPASAPAPPTRRVVAVANSDGRFVFRDVPAGSYSLTSTRNGYAPGATGRRRPDGPSRTFTLDDGQQLMDVGISMWRLATIAGTVRDDRGEPIIGVAVFVLRRTLMGGRFDLGFAGGGGESTDDRGRYRVSGLMPGSYVVNVRTSTQSAAVATVDAYQAAVISGTGAATRQVGMQTGALGISTEGLVVDGWQVSVSRGMPQPLPGPAGTLLVHPASFSGNTTSPASATVLTLAPGDDRLGVDLTLPLVSGVRVSGVLTGPEGPAANHGVRLVPVATGDSVFEVPVASSITDDAGRFALMGVPAGAYVLRAYRVPQVGTVERPAPPSAGASPVRVTETIAPPTGPPASALFADVPLTVGTAHVSGLSVVLQPGARLSGRIVFDGTAPQPAAALVQRIAFQVRPLTGSGPAATSRVDASGNFQTSGYAPGRYHFNITSPGPEWSLASVRIGGVEAVGQAFTIGTTDANDVVVTFTDKVTMLTGTVRASGSGADPDATVVVVPVDIRAWMAGGTSPRLIATATASASGAYQVRIALPGDYMVVAVPPDVVPEINPDFVTRFASSAVRVSIVAGETKVQALTVGRAR